MGKNKKCCYCSRCFGDYHDNVILKPTKEHLLPTSKGGGNEKQNILLACQLCNSMKSNMTLLEFKDFLFKNLHPIRINGALKFRGMTIDYDLCVTMHRNTTSIIHRTESYNSNPHYKL